MKINAISIKNCMKFMFLQNKKRDLIFAGVLKNTEKT